MKHTVSIVIPCFNEAESLPELYKELNAALSKQKISRWELIFVDDGSRDDTARVVSKLHQKNARVRLISFRRNLGKATALQEGFAAAKYSVIITLDADLQDDPAELGKFLDKLDEGFDLVSGWKQKRRDGLIKNQSSRIFNFFTSLLTATKLHDYNCGFKAYRREVVDSIEIYGELHRYIPVLAESLGFRISEVPVKHRTRKFGKSKYGLVRFINGYLDLLTVVFITRFKNRPLHIFGYVGLSVFALGTAIGFYLTWLRFMGERIGDRPLLLLAILLVIVGVQITISGLVAELVILNTPKSAKRNIKKTL